MKPTFTLRPFKASDLDRVMKINRQCLPENYSTYFFMDLHERFPEIFIVAEEEGEIAGYVLCRVEKGLSNYSLIRISKRGHIISIAVMPEYRRRGIGHSLMTHALSAMTNYEAEECILEVRKSNTPAVNLYKKLGFEITRTARGYYSDGEDAYKMVRKLPSNPV